MLSFLSIFALYGQKKLVILHTNDTHSRIEPMPSGDKQYPNMGGVINRKAIIDSIRRIEENVLLIDAGDMVQGTPYFNLFHGEIEMEAMNSMGYEVGTIGNHEFDNKLEGMKDMLSRLKYPIVNCNYDFSHTILKDMIKPYVILNKGGLKIGIIGVGIDPKGLIQKDNYGEMKFTPIFETVNKYAKEIRSKCDLIIALTHIGIESDLELAAQSEDIDLIIGGHSHTFMDKPSMVKNRNNKSVAVYQAGKNGVFIGKIEILLTNK